MGCLYFTNMAKSKLRKAVSKPVRRKITRSVRTTKQAKTTKSTKPNKPNKANKPTLRTNKLRGGKQSIDEQPINVVVDDFAWQILQSDGALSAWLLNFAYCENNKAQYPYLKFEPDENVHSRAVGFEQAKVRHNGDLPTRAQFEDAAFG